MTADTSIQFTTEAGNPARLLTSAAANAKLAHGDLATYEAVILHFAPARRSGYNFCSHASDGCEHACLNEAGRGGIGGPDNAIQRTRIRKSRFFMEQRAAFMAQLSAELGALVRRAAKHGRIPAARLNGTSDIGWSQVPCPRDGVTHRHVFAAFPEITFYDYTKVPSRTRPIADNYHVTFSLSENNDRDAVKALAAGCNVAVVMALAESEPLPASWGGYPVVDGVAHDFRFLDPQGGHIVALRPKGRKAQRDTSGFVRPIDGGFDLSREPVYAARRPDAIPLQLVPAPPLTSLAAD